MAKNFQDIQQLDCEESDHQPGRGEGPELGGQSPRREDPFGKERTPPPQSFLQHLCSQPRLSLLALGFNVLLLVVICVIGSKSTQLQMELRTLKETLNNFSSTILMEVWRLNSHGSNTSDSVTFLQAKLEKQNQDLKSDHANLNLHLKHFPMDLQVLACQTAFLRTNGTECCPVNWMEYEGNCYWFSRSGVTWTEANKYCQLENAHLVVINSKEEQTFILQHTNPFHSWIGLAGSDSSWKWVDGTNYENSYTNWAYSQPDNWKGHEMGGSEDCVEIGPDGRWNDDFCKQVHRWVCETKQTHNIRSP